MTKDNKGVAIIIALLTILVLSTLAASIMFSTQAEITTTYNYKRLTQARFVAEAGAQKTVNWLVYNYAIPSSFGSFNMTTAPVQYSSQPVVLSAMSGVSGNYPDSSVQSAFSSALLNQSVPGLDIGVTYATTATLQTMRVVVPFGGTTQVPLQSWLIRSQATLAGSLAQVEVTTTIEKFGSPVFSYAAFGVSNTCDAVKFSGGSTTDSFDSGTGTYATTQQNNSGNVGGNGSVDVGGGSVINGTSSSPVAATGNCTGGGAANTGLEISGGASVTGGGVTLGSTVSFAAPAAPSPAPPTTNDNTSGACSGISGCTEISSNNLLFAPGQYGNVSMTGGVTVHLTQGVYNVNTWSLAGNSTLIIDSGPVVINIAGAGLGGGNAAFDLTGGSVSNTSNSKPSDLQILYAGSNPVKLTGGSASFGVVYAPNADINLGGGGDWYGSLIGNKVDVGGGSDVHYDRSLQADLYMVGNYLPTSFGWSKY